ncbi:hydrogenase maturation protease [Kribbella solani]|uniref:Hydrogenase maturation protease n=1 Tax=Kribbella solani TaxID=236067 RepID=A0A841DIR9_9ACTN|nr:hydrogenase maturation protease [Kribbella solani]
MTTAVVIGVGNEYRRDDGIGPALVAALEDRWLPAVKLIGSDGEPARLIDDWAGVPLAIVVDAVLCDPSTPGEFYRTEVPLDHPGAAPSAPTEPPGAGAHPHSAGSHSLGIPDALRLGQAVERLPGRLVVYAVEAADVSFGTEFSAPVAAALPRLVDAVLTELKSARTVAR